MSKNPYDWNSIGSFITGKEYAKKIRKFRNGESLVKEKKVATNTTTISNNEKLSTLLQRYLRTTVKINSDQIIIHYTSDEELKNIVEKIINKG